MNRLLPFFSKSLAFFLGLTAAACSTSSSSLAAPETKIGPDGTSSDDASSSASTSPAGEAPSADSSLTTQAPPACGARTGHRGSTGRTLTVAGKLRTYRVYLPAALDPKKAVPLVFVHHGYTMSGKEMEEVTRYAALADRDGFAVVFPDGQGGPDSTNAPWNVGANVCPSLYGDVPVATGDDFAFLDAIRVEMAQDQCVDSTHVFVSGFSMGGYFAHHAGCMRPDIRAVAPHSGGTHDLSSCAVTRKPIIMFHGDADDVIPNGCEDPKGTDTPTGFTPSAKAWAARNGCSSTVRTEAVEKGTCSYYEGCPADGQVAICILKGMGHCWAGGAGGGALSNGCPGWASATDLEWKFFKTYAL